MKEHKESIKVLKRLYQNTLEQLYTNPDAFIFDRNQHESALYGIGVSIQVLGVTVDEFSDFTEALLTEFNEKYKK